MQSAPLDHQGGEVRAASLDSRLRGNDVRALRHPLRSRFACTRPLGFAKGTVIRGSLLRCRLTGWVCEVRI